MQTYTDRVGYSQLAQEFWVLDQTKNKTGGYFVEFGATNGIELSNTYLLEKDYGWTGILAEPNPINHESLFQNRKCDISKLCVYPVSGETLPFLSVNGFCNVISSLEKYSSNDYHGDARKDSIKIDVETISLNDLLKKYNAPNKIDYLSVDTEGGEYEILKSFDWNQYDVSLITVEHNHTSDRIKIYDLLVSKGYKRVQVQHSYFDDWYTKL